MITVLFFGPLAQITGLELVRMEGTRDTVELTNRLHKQYPELGNCMYQLALNQEILKTNKTLQDGDEIALLAPFAGG